MCRSNGSLVPGSGVGRSWLTSWLMGIGWARSKRGRSCSVFTLPALDPARECGRVAKVAATRGRGDSCCQHRTRDGEGDRDNSSRPHRPLPRAAAWVVDGFSGAARAHSAAARRRGSSRSRSLVRGDDGTVRDRLDAGRAAGEPTAFSGASLRSPAQCTSLRHRE
jgi:hypothetical protein